MKYIQEKLGTIGKVAFMVFFQSARDGSTWSERRDWEFSNVIAEEAQCEIRFHIKTSNRGEPAAVDSDISFSLRTVQKIVVEPWERMQDEIDAKAGHPEFIATSTNPPITLLQVTSSNKYPSAFIFSDNTLAERVAKAITHAVELCGGGDKDPFK
jgi:hypothetical protein